MCGFDEMQFINEYDDWADDLDEAAWASVSVAPSQPPLRMVETYTVQTTTLQYSFGQ